MIIEHEHDARPCQCIQIWAHTRTASLLHVHPLLIIGFTRHPISPGRCPLMQVVIDLSQSEMDHYWNQVCDAQTGAAPLGIRTPQRAAMIGSKRGPLYNFCALVAVTDSLTHLTIYIQLHKLVRRASEPAGVSCLGRFRGHLPSPYASRGSQNKH